jgi:hypothetical protein
MLFNTFRAAATALFLGTAALAAATVSMTASAEAAARAAVGRPLQEALRAAAAGNFSAARNAVAAAEGVGGLTAGDQAAIAEVKQYIAAKSGSGGGGGCAGLYLKGDYRGVIALRGGDAQCMQLTAQAYYLSHDFAGCSRYIRNSFGSGAGEQILQLQMRCAYESQDNDSMRTALEQLVARTNKPEYWTQLLNTAQGAKGLTDHGTLDIYRLKLLTNTLTKPDDYNLLAQLALQLGFAAESQAVIQKGIDAKLLTGDRTTRLLNMAKGQAGANAAGQAKALAAANAAPTGDALVKLGEDAWGQGRFPDALNLVQAGIRKGVTDKDNAQIRLGMAYLGAGQKDQAARAFDHANTDPRQAVVAHLWSIYARTH